MIFSFLIKKSRLKAIILTQVPCKFSALKLFYLTLYDSEYVSFQVKENPFQHSAFTWRPFVESLKDSFTHHCSLTLGLKTSFLLNIRLMLCLFQTETAENSKCSSVLRWYKFLGLVKNMS